MVDPLRKLLRKDSEFKWDSKCQTCFDEVRRFLSGRCLQLFDPALQTIVTTDASAIGLGAVLQQRRGHDLVSVAFASRRLADAEKKHSTCELEALARVWACEHWRVYLWGRSFTLHTDHQALVTVDH